MTKDTNIAAIIIILVIFACLSIGLIYAASTFEPFVSSPPQHHPIVQCPDCHLVKQRPSECSHETQAWAWDECVLMEYLHRHPNE